MTANVGSNSMSSSCHSRRRAAICMAFATTMAAGFSTAATAQTTRTYVSIRGSDGNACSANAPCRTFQAALSKTQQGGEILVLNSGDYGSLTVSQAVIIASARAAGVLASGTVSGITI